MDDNRSRNDMDMSASDETWRFNHEAANAAPTVCQP
jgi:hypothetical protein